MAKAKKSIFENPILSTKVKSANTKIFPEGALGYFLGPTLALLANSILAGYFNRYMQDVLGIGSSWAKTFFTWLPVISVIFVVLGNILVGRLMDRSRTKAGKARPLILLSIPISILALLMLFVFTPFSQATSAKGTQMTALVLIAIGYNLWFAVAYPFYYTSHASLVNLSTRNSKDRSLLATISNATSLAAVGLCSMILPFFLGMLFVNQKDASGNILTDPNGVAIIDAQASFNNWKIFVIALIIITAVGAIVEYYFTRERVTEESFANASLMTQKKAVSVRKQAGICLKDKFWWLMILFFFLYQFGGMLKNVSQLYFCASLFPIADPKTGELIYSTANGGVFQGTLSIVGAIPTALGMVIAWPLSNKIGKGKAIFAGAILSTVGGAIGFIDPTNFYLVVASFVIKALGSTPAMYLSLALLADTLDHQEAMHKTRTDGFSMTIYGAIMAGMTGIATGVLNMVVTATDYSNAMSAVGTQNAMTWLFIGGETLCYACIGLLFIFMGVEKFSRFDHKAITLDQKAAALAEGSEYVDPATRLKQEEAEADAAAEKQRVADLKARCEKKGLDFEAEEAKYQKARADKETAAAAKKAAAEEKRAAAEKAKQAKFDALSDEKKAAIEAKNKRKAEKQAKKDADAFAEFNRLRAANGQTVLTEADLADELAQSEPTAVAEPNAAETVAEPADTADTATEPVADNTADAHDKD